jgi:DNA-binding protein HU-beta
MNKSDFISAVSEKAELTKKDSKMVVDAVIDALTEVLANGEDVNLSPFGKFEVSVRAARKGRNPQTGDEIDIPEKQVVKFKASKKTKEVVNGE